VQKLLLEMVRNDDDDDNDDNEDEDDDDDDDDDNDDDVDDDDDDADADDDDVRLSIRDALNIKSIYFIYLTLYILSPSSVFQSASSPSSLNYRDVTWS